MRIEGILKTWNDERGFGFIEPVQGGQEIFVHAKAFRAGNGRPQVGQYVSFAIDLGPQGKKRAKDVELVRVARVRKETRSRPDSPRRNSRGPTLLAPMKKLALLALMAFIGWSAYGRYQERALARMEPDQPVATRSVPLSSDKSFDTSGLRCDGRIHCSQMTSCAEATWFLHNCPGTKMDGNHDGVPCEQQWCR